MTDDDRETLGYPKTFELGDTCTGFRRSLRGRHEDGWTKARPGMGPWKEMSSVGWMGTVSMLLTSSVAAVDEPPMPIQSSVLSDKYGRWETMT